jgi:hypothetical protein
MTSEENLTSPQNESAEVFKEIKKLSKELNFLYHTHFQNPIIILTFSNKDFKEDKDEEELFEEFRKQYENHEPFKKCFEKFENYR